MISLVRCSSFIDTEGALGSEGTLWYVARGRNVCPGLKIVLDGVLGAVESLFVSSPRRSGAAMFARSRKTTRRCRPYASSRANDSVERTLAGSVPPEICARLGLVSPNHERFRYRRTGSQRLRAIYCDRRIYVAEPHRPSPADIAMMGLRHCSQTGQEEGLCRMLAANKFVLVDLDPSASSSAS